MKKWIIIPILVIGVNLNLNATSIEEDKKACALGDVTACNKLGVMYVKGKEVKQNYVKAKEFFEKSCNAGDDEGCKKYKITKSLIGYSSSNTLDLKNDQPKSTSIKPKVTQSNPKAPKYGSKLYKDFRFGMPKIDIEKMPAVYNCSEVFEKGALCLDNESFVGEEVSLAFRFIEEKLVAVALLGEFSQESYLQFIGALNSKFQLVTIESGNDKLDFMVQFKTNKKSDFKKTIVDFEERAFASGNIKYTFFEKDSFRSMAKKSNNAVEMLLNADKNMRVVQYVIIETNNQDTFNLIQFTTPQEIHRILLEKSKQSYGEF